MHSIKRLQPLEVGEPLIGTVYRIEGWVYRDLPWAPVSLWEYNVGVTAPENVFVLTQHDGIGPDGTPIRCGQVLISPEGMQRLKYHILLNSAGGRPN